MENIGPVDFEITPKYFNLRFVEGPLNAIIQRIGIGIGIGTGGKIQIGNVGHPNILVTLASVAISQG